MSTKVGLITEGPIDQALLPPLLSRIAQVRVGFTWPVRADDLDRTLHIRSTGHGGVLEKVRRLVQVLDDPDLRATFDHACFVIVLDRRTRAVQEEVRQLISGRDRFVMGVAIEEVEAWWLGDRKNTLAWAELDEPLRGLLRYAAQSYHAESDDAPKRTLSELTEEATRFDSVYGEGDVEMASEFAERYWQDFARLDDIRGQCSQGFGRFDQAMTNVFRRIRASNSGQPT